jgi:hypothetical protein
VGAVRVGDPEIYWDEPAGLWHLYFTGDVDGSRRIGHAESTALSSLAFTGWVVEAAAPATAVDMPSVARSGDGRWILAARVERDGGQAIGIFISADAAGPFVRHDGALEDDTFRTDGGGSNFDADEIAAPSLRVVDGAYHLYFAGRRGTRWGIGVWTSAELVYWRPVTRRAAILGGSGDGFDALGALSPDLFVDGPSAELFYVGSDGETSTLGHVSRAHPEGR